MYCTNVIERIQMRSDITRYFPKGMKCKKCGGDLTVSRKHQMYWCEKCQPKGSAGNVFTALMESESKNFRQVVEYLAKKEEIELRECIYSEDEYTMEECKKCILFRH